MAKVLEGKSSQTPETLCHQIKIGINKSYNFITQQQRDLDPDQAHGLQVLFAELPELNRVSQTFVNIYNDLNKKDIAACKGVLNFLGGKVEIQWVSNFEGLMGCFNHLDQCVNPTTLARSK